MKDYQEYQRKLGEFSEKEKTGAIENFGPAAFLIVGAAITAAATYYLNEKGMKDSPLYAKTIGADNAAFLVMGILEGTLIALTLGGHWILKSGPQREAGRTGRIVVKIILSLNLVVAFVLLSGYGTSIMPAVEFYAQWGVPLSVVAALWFWGYIVSHRRETIMRNEMLDRAADAEKIWSEQYQQDQLSYRETYRTVFQTPEMAELRAAAARSKAIGEIARAYGISYGDAEALYNANEARRLGGGGPIPLHPGKM